MEITRSVRVEAPAQRVWELVSDLPRMGELSPESAGGSWRGGATGPAVGSRLRGTNRAGWRRWSTEVTVTRCEPGSAFGFEVRALGLGVARWDYTFEPDGAGACTVTEGWTDRRGRVMKVVGALTSGVSDRAAFTVTSIEQTLAALKSAAERTA